MTVSNRTRTESVAVVIVHWNCVDHLERCLAALAQQTIQPNRIVIVDNGGLEESRLRESILVAGIELIDAGGNIGFAAANNLAVRSIKDCDYIALLNPDAIPQSTWLDELLAAAGRHPDFSCFASRQLQVRQPDRLDGAGDVYHVSGLVWRRGVGQRAEQVFNESSEVFSACAAAALFRRDHFLEVGGFDESYFCYFEDVDLGFRLRLAGRRTRYVPQAVVAHVGSAATRGHSDVAVYHGHRNLVWTYWKNMPWPWIYLYLPQHLFWNFAAMVRFVGRGQAVVIFRAKWDAMRAMKRIWRMRKKLQRERTVSGSTLRALMMSNPLEPFWSVIRQNHGP